MMERTSWIILGLAVLAGALGGWMGHQRTVATLTGATPPAAVDRGLIGQPVPALKLTDLDGHAERLDSWHGQPVLLNFWASWCAPCIAEMPELDQFQKQQTPGAVQVIGVAMDEPARVAAFLREHPVEYPILLGSLASPSATRQLGDTAEVLPYSVLLDAHGRIVAMHVGQLSKSELEAWSASAGNEH